MDSLQRPEEGRADARVSPHRMSVQWHHNLHVDNNPTRISKSLPNIQILCSETECCGRTSNLLSNCPEPEGSKKTVYSSQHQSTSTQKPKILKKTWDKVKTIIHNPALGSSGRRESLRKSEQQGRAPLQRTNAFCSAPSTPLDTGAFEFEEPYGDERERIARNYALLQKRLSEELHQRMSECKCGGGGEDRVVLSGVGNRFPEHLSDEFRKKLQQWEMWKASTGKFHFTDEELREIVPEEFGKKLVEWEVIRGGGQVESVVEESCEEVRGKGKKKFVGSNADLPQSQHHQKELAWLDKQLEKIEVEKKRLEREMKKYLERETRLEKMKEALKNSPTTDVYIKTPTAKCRVEKITEKFAKKLYEWEEKQGIGPESSALGLLNPKYYAEVRGEELGEEVENREVVEEEQGDVEEEEVLGPLDLINARLKAAEEEEETEQDKSVRRAMEHVAEALALADEEVVGIVREAEGGISSTASSCCCSAEYEDSFATKNNSGASNTDSEFYSAKPDPSKLCTGARRRSSDAISTPLSGDARSPSLSAFTSDDDENGPLLRRVSEEQDDNCGTSVSRHSTIRGTGVVVTFGEVEQVKDAESQTDVVVRAKQIVVDDEEEAGNDEWDCGNGIFVQTKRTIFAPIVGELDEAVVLIREDEGVTHFTGSSVSIPGSSQGVGDKVEEGPKVVGAIPKRPTNLSICGAGQPPHPYKTQPKTQFHRSFPKMGKIPVWCSPLVARKQMFSGGEEQGGSDSVSVTTPDDSDFSIDRFLQDSKLLDAAMNTSVGEGEGGEGGREVKKHLFTSRLPRTNAFVPRKYTIGGGYPPRSGVVLTRSNSFGYPKGGDVSRVVGTSESVALAGSNVTLESVAGAQLSSTSVQGSMHSVTKSKSTGSIKSKFGRAFAKVGLGFGGGSSGGKGKSGVGEEEKAGPSQVQVDDTERVPGPSRRRESSGCESGAAAGGFTGMNPLRRFGSWVSRVGGNSGGGGGGSGGGDAAKSGGAAVNE